MQLIFSLQTVHAAHDRKNKIQFKRKTRGFPKHVLNIDNQEKDGEIYSSLRLKNFKFEPIEFTSKPY